MLDPIIVRLFISQIFMCYILLTLVPLKEPIKRNRIIIIIGVFLVTLANAIMIGSFGLADFYLRYFFLTLVVPLIILFSCVAVYRGPRLWFAFLSLEVLGSVAVINGIFVSYLLGGIDQPLADSLTRVLTYVLLLPFIFKFARPQYRKMIATIKTGWWLLDLVLIISYALTYFVAFVPTPILYRPEYFVHTYITILLSLLVYFVIFMLFWEIESKINAERDKQLLAIQVVALEAQSSAIADSEEKVKIIKHDMRHQLAILSEQIEAGDLQEATRLLGHLDTKLKEITHPVYCANKVINATLRHYFALAIQNNIQVDAQLDIPEKIAINDSELAIVFANAIENAIRACSKIEDPTKKIIHASSRHLNHNLLIEITNPTVDEVVFGENGLPISTDKEHGTGVVSMRAFAKKNDAILDFSIENHTFVVRLVINSISSEI